MQYNKFCARIMMYMMLGAVTIADGVELNKMSEAGLVQATLAACRIDDTIARIWRDIA